MFTLCNRRDSRISKTNFLFIGFWLVAVLAIFGVWSTVSAETATEEAITSFESNIIVNLDNSITVVETIVYETGPTERHGLYSDITPFSSTKRKMAIEDITVTDLAGLPYQFEKTVSGGRVRLKIGDPNQIFGGQKTYIIKYRATEAIGQLKEMDEIYWNATGNGWEIPIYKALASITLPAEVAGIQSACYVGPKGSQTPCQLEGGPSTYLFTAPTRLEPQEGLTVAVGFAKGIMPLYPVPGFWAVYGWWLFLILLPILTLILSLRSWYKTGRDPKGKGVIIPEYDVPDGLTPMEVVGIVKEGIVGKDFSAEIIYLATQGYLKIEQLEEKIIGFIKMTDYKLIKLKDSVELTNEFDQKLMAALFEPPMTAVKLSDLKNKFYKKIPKIHKSALTALLTKGYYKTLGRMDHVGLRVFLFAFFLWGIFFVGFASSSVAFNGNPMPLLLSLFLSLIIYLVVYHFSPAKTEKGVQTKEYLLGLKDYLQIAEKDRLIFHNAPEKKPEVFEKLLPYAMVLGVADIWAKEFEDIYLTPPAWYSGNSTANFNSVAFCHSLSSFSTHTMSSMGAPGSSGGGSSGGGGGGGGGGGW